LDREKIVFLIPFRRENLAFSRGNLVVTTKSEVSPDSVDVGRYRRKLTELNELHPED
jgi:hypothetical protein